MTAVIANRISIHSAEFLDRFLSKLKLMPSGCWEWQAATNIGGYGVVQADGRLWICSRVAYELFIGKLPPSVSAKGATRLMVLHSCDNPPCCNPMHLSLGTNQDNMNDKVARGRVVRFIGENSGRAKLVEAQVLQIRDLISAGLMGTQIAAMFNVAPETIQAIKKRRSWKHL